MTRLAAVADKGIDYSFARPVPALTFKAGGRFILRYSAGVGNTAANTQGKLCGAHEIAEAVAAGMDFYANAEWYESRITEGAAAGRADGKADLAFWRSRGLARGASIFCSWDQNPTRSKWVAACSYLLGYQASLGTYYYADCYAGTQFLKYAISKKAIRFGWRPNAGAWSNDGLPYQPKVTAALIAKAQKATPAGIWQNGNYWWNKGADENVLLRVGGSHLWALDQAAKAAAKAKAKQQPKPAPKPAPKPYYAIPPRSSRLLVSTDGAWAVYIDTAGRLVTHHNGKRARVL